MNKIVPLPKSFMVIGLLGLLIVLVYSLYGTISVTWGFATGLVFVMMIIASIISMENAPLEEELETNAK